MLMDLIPTFRTAELIMSLNPLTSDHYAELVISMSVWQCDWAEKGCQAEIEALAEIYSAAKTFFKFGG